MSFCPTNHYSPQHIFDSSTNSFSCWCCLRSAGSGWGPLNQSEQLNIWRLEAMLNWAQVWYSSNMALFLEQIHDGQPWYWSLIRRDRTWPGLISASEWCPVMHAEDVSHNVQIAAASHISHISYMLCAYSNNKILFLHYFYYCLKNIIAFYQSLPGLELQVLHCLAVVGSLCPKNPEVS